MTSDVRIAIGFSVGLHGLLLGGLPSTEPPAFDVERAPTSVELFLVAPKPPQPPAPPDTVRIPEEAPRPQPQPAEPSPQMAVSEERKGASVDVLPGYLRNPPPRYPKTAQERDYQGTVVLDVEVLSSGRCGTVNVLSSSGHHVLDQAAVRAVRNWVFKPARRLRQPVAFWVEVPVTFRLVDGTIPNVGLY